MVFDPATGESSAVTQQDFDICKELWKVLIPIQRCMTGVEAVIDANPRNHLEKQSRAGLAQAMVVDLGETLVLSGLPTCPPSNVT